METLKENEMLLLLKAAVSRGIINTADVQKKLEMTKKEEYLNLHKKKFNIWQGTNESWYTYLPDTTKKAGRKLVKKSTLTKIETDILDYYKALDKKESSNKICLRDFYPTWLEYKQLRTEGTSYIRRIDDDWNKFYKDTEIVKIPLIQLDFITLDTWAHTILKKYSLTKVQYYNMSIIIRQALELAKEMEMIPANTFANVKINSKLFRSTKKAESEKQVFQLDEKPLIEQEACKDFEANCTKSSAPLAIPLLFQLGCRLGELVALKTTDIEGNNLHIQRQEVNQETRKADGTWAPARKIVVEHTKSSAGDRYVYLSIEARKLIQKIIDNNKEQGFSDGDYIFLDRKGRIHERAVDTRIRKYCRTLGFKHIKSCHDIRRTYISTLIDINININKIREQAGHSDELTTYKNYCFNRMNDEQTEQALESALSS